VKKLSQQLVKASYDLYKTKLSIPNRLPNLPKEKRLRGLICRLKRRIICGIFRRLILTNWSRYLILTRGESKLNVFGKQFEQVLGEGGGNKTGTTKVFATEGMSKQDIFNYAQSLTGGVPLQGITIAPGRYYAVLSNGSTVNLRSVSKSKDETKARWTLDIIKMSNLTVCKGK